MTRKRLQNQIKREVASLLRTISRSVHRSVGVKQVRNYEKRPRGIKDRVKEIERFSNLVVYVGVLANKGGETHSSHSLGAKLFRKRGIRISSIFSSKTVLEIGTLHEFGSPGGKIPKRSFVRGYYDEKIVTIREGIRLMGISVVEGKRSATDAAAIIGQTVVGGMQERMTRGIPGVPKGAPRRLIDTGQLRSSITYEVRTKGSE